MIGRFILLFQFFRFYLNVNFVRQVLHYIVTALFLMNGITE